MFVLFIFADTAAQAAVLLSLLSISHRGCTHRPTSVCLGVCVVQLLFCQVRKCLLLAVQYAVKFLFGSPTNKINKTIRSLSSY